MPHIWRLTVQYPEGSLEPGWRPKVWTDSEFYDSLSKRQRRKLDRTEFKWPRVHNYQSGSGANDRAWLLRWYGAEVDIERSYPVEWPQDADLQVTPFGEQQWWPNFDASGIPYDKQDDDE